MYSGTPTHLHTYTPTHLHTYTPTHQHTYTPTHTQTMSGLTVIWMVIGQSLLLQQQEAKSPMLCCAVPCTINHPGLVLTVTPDELSFEATSSLVDGAILNDWFVYFEMVVGQGIFSQCSTDA